MCIRVYIKHVRYQCYYSGAEYCCASKDRGSPPPISRSAGFVPRLLSEGLYKNPSVNSVPAAARGTHRRGLSSPFPVRRVHACASFIRRRRSESGGVCVCVGKGWE